MERKERVVCLIKRYPYHHVMKWMFENNPVAARAVNLSAAKELGPVVRSLVSGNRWLRGIKTFRFPWYLTLVSANHASSNPGLIFSQLKSDVARVNDTIYLLKLSLLS